MTNPADTAWRCTVCGYVHHGASPPDFCPVCGAGSRDFETCSEVALATPEATPAHWQCLNCNYVHAGPTPPDACPVCGATAERFEPLQAPPAAAGTTSDNLSLLIIGGGIAGVSAAEAARKAAPKATISLLSEENAAPYYRLNLTRYLGDEIALEALPIHPLAWYAEQRIELVLGCPVTGVTLDPHTLTVADGRSWPFDRLILAMGSHPFVPPLPGTQLPGVFSLRTATDARAILAAAANGPCVCVGGGVLGLETAAALARRGLDVTVLESHGWLMPRQLDRTAGDYLERHLQQLGVKLRKQAQTAEFLATDGALTAIRFDDGSRMPAVTAVLATGVRPNTHLARRLGLEVNKGIVVDNHLRTSHPDVYAAGDVAEHHGVLYGVWGASQYQGRIAGLNAVGMPTVFGGLPRANTLKILNLDLTSIGQFEVPDGSYRSVDHRGRVEYYHFVFHDNQLVGAILLGPSPLAPAVKKAIEQHTDFGDLLQGQPAATTIMARLQALTGA